MSRFIRKAGQTAGGLSLGEITQGFRGSHFSTTSSSIVLPGGSTIAKITAIGGGGGGAFNTQPGSSCAYGQSSGGGAGTVIAYVDVTGRDKSIVWSIGAGGASSPECNGGCCRSCGGTGGNTTVNGSGFTITACGGCGGCMGGFSSGVFPGFGGCGAASGTLGCIIIQGGPGQANVVHGCNACQFCQSMDFRGGNTYFGMGATGAWYWASSCVCCGNYTCATYGGGGNGIMYMQCGGMCGQPGAPGAVFIEYN